MNALGLKPIGKYPLTVPNGGESRGHLFGMLFFPVAKGLTNVWVKVGKTFSFVVSQNWGEEPTGYNVGVKTNQMQSSNTLCEERVPKKFYGMGKGYGKSGVIILHVLLPGNTRSRLPRFQEMIPQCPLLC